MTHLRKSYLITISALIIATAAFAKSNKVHWSYEGDTGPDKWSALHENHAACSGDEQSPIDLKHTHDADTEDIKLDWKTSKLTVVNNGHTVQANIPGENVTSFGVQQFKLIQFHFHHKSEHAINGKHSPLEAHFVHKGADGDLLVLGVMFEQGPENSEIAEIWSATPGKIGEGETKTEIDIASLVPEGATYYRYAGSLTTPPCSQIVHWSVYTKPQTMSAEQISFFADLYPKNNRPLQPVNRRFILVGE